MDSNVLKPVTSSDVLSRRSEPRQVRVIKAPSFSPLVLLLNLRILTGYLNLLFTLTEHRIKVRYKQSALGIAWAVLQPLSLMLIYTLIFSVIAKMPSNGTPYAIFTYVALLPWICFSTALSTATNGLISHSNLITKVYFPREILPLTYVFAALFDLVVASSVLAGMMLYYHVQLTMKVFYVIPIITILTVFVTGASFIFSAVQVRFRDIGLAIPLLMQLWMFVTPVVYPLSAVPPRFRGLYVLNPMVGVIESFRRVVLQGESPDFTSLGISAAIAVILLPISYIFFKHVEATVADII